MTLKHDGRRTVPLWLAQLNPGALETMNFPLQAILEHSLYYPAAEFDGRPVQFLGGFIHSFIYVDYGVQATAVDAAALKPGFLGYHMAGSKSLEERDFTPLGWAPRVPPQYRNLMPTFDTMQAEGLVRSPFANWYIFDRDGDRGEDHGPQRFSLVYLCADGVATYQALYWQNQSAPEVLTIIQPGHGCGGNYTNFEEPKGFFAWTVLQGNGPHVPRYLVCGGRGLDYAQAFWPEAYPEHVEWFQLVNGNGVWRQR